MTSTQMYDVVAEPQITETHKYVAVVDLRPGGEPMMSTPRYHGNKSYRFQPASLSLSWKWSPEDDDWVLTAMAVSGLRLNKDGSFHASRMYDSRQFLSAAGTLLPETPEQFVQLAAAELAPVSKVTGEIR